jgi:hypothetical protein
MAKTQIDPETQIQRDKFEQLAKELFLQLLDDPDVQAKVRQIVGAG